VSEPVIELREVVKRFVTGGRATTALDRLSASIGGGQITGLVGPDGAGKTTLMRLVTGLLAPDEGQVRVLGLNSVADSEVIQANVGYMPQRFGLYEDLTVAENMALYADLQGVGAAARAPRFERLLRFTGLAPFTGRLAGRLSGGMKQKLGLACTLVHPPGLLLLDEPSVGVDPVSRRELWQIVETLVGEGMSVLWSTAYLDEAERCQDVILLSEGRLLDQGPPEQFRARVHGRTFAFATEPAKRRAVLRAVRARPDVVDALIKGRDVRVLLAKAADPADLARPGAALGVTPRPVEPVFEDAFVALLRNRPAAPPPAAEAHAALAAGASSAVSNPVDPSSAPTMVGGHDAGPVIEVADLVRVFGTFRAVDGISFAVTGGEIFGLLGPNGAGKSTTFKMLCGLLPPSDGKALVLGIDLRRAAAVARGRIGYMAQKFSLYGSMSVLQNLGFFASAYGLAGPTKQAKIEAFLDEFALRRFADAESGELPLGYKQRLALACALMHEPGVLFLDEPTSGVDPLARREFWARINAMAAAGMTVMVTTHFMDEAEYCDRIGIIYRGRLVATGPPDELKAAHATPAHPEPTLEAAFIDLIEDYDRAHPQ
jgi:drug efflux transport system ATP-binding protein